jgi:hypothetical protein
MTGDANSRFPGVVAISNTTPGLTTLDPVVYPADGSDSRFRMGTPVGIGLSWSPDVPGSVPILGFRFDNPRPALGAPLSVGTYPVNTQGEFGMLYLPTVMGTTLEPGRVVINSSEWVTDGISMLDFNFEMKTMGSAVPNVRGHVHFEDTNLNVGVPGTISGYAWRDTNRDGNRDANEEPIANSNVTLLDESGSGFSRP